LFKKKIVNKYPEFYFSELKNWNYIVLKF
jgi:hypothetical protein